MFSRSELQSFAKTQDRLEYIAYREMSEVIKAAMIGHSNYVVEIPDAIVVKVAKKLKEVFPDSEIQIFPIEPTLLSVSWA